LLLQQGAVIVITMLNGVVVPILKYTTYNYAQLIGSTETIIVADRIPIVPFQAIGLSVRVHRKSIAAGGSYQFHIYGINPSDEDGADFVTASLGSITAISGTGTNALVGLSTSLAPIYHPMIRVGLTIVGTTAAGVHLATFSADLVMRPSS